MGGNFRILLKEALCGSERKIRCLLVRGRKMERVDANKRLEALNIILPKGGDKIGNGSPRRGQYTCYRSEGATGECFTHGIDPLKA
jgi:hypothetical protein